MKRLSIGWFALTLMICLLVLPAAAQRARPRPRATPAATTATPTPTPAAVTGNAATIAPANNSASPTIAIVNGTAVRVSDLDADVQKAVAEMEPNILILRSEALEAQINTLLLEAEAEKRKTTVDALLEQEINSRIANPTDAEVQAVYDTNRAQIGNAPLAQVAPQIVSYLKQQQVRKLTADFATRLRGAYPVKIEADPNGQLRANTVLATAAGKTLLAGEFNERLKPVIYRLRRETWTAEMNGLDERLNTILLEAEAQRRSLTAQQIFQEEVGSKVTAPTEAEIAKFYTDNRERISAPLENVRNGISEYLMQQKQEALSAALAERLRKSAKIEILLAEPTPPVQFIETTGEPARGKAEAPVTVVMFTDFQCPSCAAVHPVLEQVLPEFGDKVRFVVRDFPLPQHTNARKAAEAAQAAGAQGKFFEYIAVLFRHQNALDVPALKRYALELGLDAVRFSAELDSGKYAAGIQRDVEDGVAYGVDATPTIFVNGVKLQQVSPDAIRKAVNNAITPLRGVSVPAPPTN